LKELKFLDLYSDFLYVKSVGASLERYITPKSIVRDVSYMPSQHHMLYWTHFANEREQRRLTLLTEYFKDTFLVIPKIEVCFIQCIECINVQKYKSKILYEANTMFFKIRY
jgi:hypothetical protein